MDKTFDITVIGECLVELSTNGSIEETSTFNKYYGGDTVTTAVTFARMGGKVSLITNVGNDGFRNFIINSILRENIDTSQIKYNDEQNGMYIVSHDSKNREFLYYKRKTAATKLGIENTDLNSIMNAEVLYTSGVIQSLSASARELVKTSFQTARQNGVLTAYDPNYTSCFMNSADTKEYFEEIIDLTDIVFLSLKNNGIKLYEAESIDKIMQYMWDRGVKIAVIKSHVDNGYYVGADGEIKFTEFYNSSKAIDTTASGDVFNGGYLYAITHGYTPFTAAKFAAMVSGIQTQNYGAIKAIPYKENLLELI